MRIRDDIASQIEAGQLKPQTRLPPERTLSDTFRLTRMTVRQALFQLEGEGLIYRLNRSGWFVSPSRLRYDPATDISFTENVRAQGGVAGTQILSTEETIATPWACQHLHLSADAPLYLVNRLRLISERAVLVERLHVNAALCPGLLDLPLDQSLSELLAQHYGIIVRRARVSMHPAALIGSQADALGVSNGTPGLYLTRTSFDQFNNVIEFDQEFWRHEALEIYVDVSSKNDISKEDKGETADPHPTTQFNVNNGKHHEQDRADRKD